MDNIPQSRKRPKAKTAKKVTGDDFNRARARLDKKKLARDRKTHWAHFWNVCPKCGGDMFEQETTKIRFEVCRACNGVYIDQAEIALAFKHLDPAKWLKAVLQRSKKPNTKLG
jgi:Zn-finger nucleic acid-binding protein